MMNADRIKHCRLFKGDMDVPQFRNTNLQYAFYAEAFYCDEERENAREAAADAAFYKVDFSAYGGIPTPLLNQLFSVWMNKLAGSSHPEVVIPGFHNIFMYAYLHADRLQHCRLYDGEREPDMEIGFDEYYFAMAEKFYVREAGTEKEQDALRAVHSLHLEDLAGEVPIELVAQLYATCDHVLQRGSWQGVSPEHVAKRFREDFFPKYLSLKL